jgi:hypothetical protein
VFVWSSEEKRRGHVKRPLNAQFNAFSIRKLSCTANINLSEVMCSSEMFMFIVMPQSPSPKLHWRDPMSWYSGLRDPPYISRDGDGFLIWEDEKIRKFSNRKINNDWILVILTNNIGNVCSNPFMKFINILFKSFVATVDSWKYKTSNSIKFNQKPFYNITFSFV